MHGPDGSDNEADEADGGTSSAAAAVSNEEWLGWLRADVEKSAAYAEHTELLLECCAIAGRWRERFWERKALWGRIRRGRRLAKELAESVPVLARARTEAAKFEVAPGGPKLLVLDLCSGFGYLAMFLSELLPPDKVEKIVLVDIKWALPHIERQPHHINPEHLEDAAWPIPLSTRRADLKASGDRRALAATFLSQAQPALLLGVHLCSTLSLRAVELFNDCPAIAHLALKPCCLPPLVFAQRAEVFEIGGHRFPACRVCAAGKWKKNKWGSGRSPCAQTRGDCAALWTHDGGRSLDSRRRALFGLTTAGAPSYL